MLLQRKFRNVAVVHVREDSRFSRAFDAKECKRAIIVATTSESVRGIQCIGTEAGIGRKVKRPEIDIGFVAGQQTRLLAGGDAFFCKERVDGDCLRGVV